MDHRRDATLTVLTPAGESAYTEAFGLRPIRVNMELGADDVWSNPTVVRVPFWVSPTLMPNEFFAVEGLRVVVGGTKLAIEGFEPFITSTSRPLVVTPQAVYQYLPGVLTVVNSSLSPRGAVA